MYSTVSSQSLSPLSVLDFWDTLSANSKQKTLSWVMQEFLLGSRFDPSPILQKDVEGKRAVPEEKEKHDSFLTAL